MDFFFLKLALFLALPSHQLRTWLLTTRSCQRMVMVLLQGTSLGFSNMSLPIPSTPSSVSPRQYSTIDEFHHTPFLSNITFSPPLPPPPPLPSPSRPLMRSSGRHIDDSAYSITLTNIRNRRPRPRPPPSSLASIAPIRRSPRPTFVVCTMREGRRPWRLHNNWVLVTGSPP